VARPGREAKENAAMKRTLGFLMLATLIAGISTGAIAQKPGKEGSEDSPNPKVGKPAPRPHPRPQPQPQPRSQQPQPQPRSVQPQPQPRSVEPQPKFEQPEPRRNPTSPIPQGQPQPRRANPPSNPQPKFEPQPRSEPKFEQPEPRRSNPPTNPQPKFEPQPRPQPKFEQPEPRRNPTLPQPDAPRVTPPLRNQPKLEPQPEPQPRRRANPNPQPEPTPEPKFDPKPTPRAGGANEPLRRQRPAPISPSGKPRNEGIPPQSKTPAESPNQQQSIPQVGSGAPREIPAKRPLGKPTEPVRRAGAGKVESVAKPPSGPTPIPYPNTAKAIPASASPEVKNLAKPARMRTIQPKVMPEDGPRKGPFPKKEIPAAKPRRERQVAPIYEAPEGGREYRHGHYRHEYAHKSHSSWSFGIGISDGSTSLAFGYSNGYAPYHHNPYWGSAAWYTPGYYRPYYGVPVYPVYAPVYYQPVLVDPYAYNSSSFAFGYSSFGGCALSSFGFAYSSSSWGIGFGWNSAPAYSIYTPVYDPYFRSVWMPGYYQIASERAWVPGRYEEVVSTPVVETVLDPLGNTYDAVTQPGSVDYVWREGYWTIEDRRIWVPGHFEYVSAF
jgi:hypothetical protein